MAAAAAAHPSRPVLGAVARAALLLSLMAVALLAAEKKSRQKPKPLINFQRTKLIPRLYNLEHCADKEHALRVLNSTQNMGAHGSDLFDMDLEMLRGAKLISEVKTVLQRCTGAISSNMCEKYDTWSFSTAVCEMMVSKAFMWKSIMQLIQPPVKCPLEPGVYKLHNATLDLDVIDKTIPGLNLDKYIWPVEVQVYDERRALLACLKWVTEARRVRVKDEGLFG